MASFCKIAICLAISLALCVAQSQNGTESGGQPDAATGGVMCYQCNSFKDEGCADPANETLLKEQNLAVSCPAETKSCFKYNQEVQSDIRRLSRGCAVKGRELAIEDKGLEEGCSFSTGTKAIQLQICTCKGNNGNPCNGAGINRSPVFILAAAGFMAIVAQLLQ